MVSILGKFGLLVSFITSILALEGDGVAQKTLLATVSGNPAATVDAGTIVGTTAAVIVTVSTAVPAVTATVTVNKYLGIPYAATPPERFSPPKPANAFNASLIAQAYKPACFQEFRGKE